LNSAPLKAERSAGFPVRPTIHGVFPRLLVGPIRVFYGDVALGNGTEWRIGAFGTLHGLFVGVVGRGAAEFIAGTFDDYQVATALGLYMGDAGNFTDLINDQLAPGRPRLGWYKKELCDEAGEADDY